jgi:cell division protein ZipA
MDKELLRVVIIAVGLIVVVGMLARHFLKNKKSFQDMMFFGHQERQQPEFKGKINEAIVVHTENDDFEVSHKTKKPVFSEDDDDFFGHAAQDDPAADMFGDLGDSFNFPAEDLPEEPVTPRFVAPEIIQFSVMAKTHDGFNGVDLLKAFQIAQLNYGNLKIFERLDANRLVDFGVACMSGSGTFPETDMDDFYCPGLVFFMQPGVLDDAVRVFDDFLEAINLVAIELDGTLLDHERKPLTNATILNIRQSL